MSVRWRRESVSFYWGGCALLLLLLLLRLQTLDDLRRRCRRRSRSRCWPSSLIFRAAPRDSCDASLYSILHDVENWVAIWTRVSNSSWRGVLSSSLLPILLLENRLDTCKCVDKIVKDRVYIASEILDPLQILTSSRYWMDQISSAKQTQLRFLINKLWKNEQSIFARIIVDSIFALIFL